MKHLTLPRFWRHYRQLPSAGRVEVKGIVWFWIGTHAEYDKLLA